MRWAVRESTGHAVSILQLAREDTGLACKCICPACSSPLQAVNAGVGPEHFMKKNARGQFFRHQTGQQREHCRLVIARLAALQLLVEGQQVDLPPPRRKATVQGNSGALYHGEVLGQPCRAYVVSHAWYDSQAASITLDDGRVIFVRLDSSREVTEQGSFDGIITITVDDPEVAAWDMQTILQRVQLHDERGLACWDTHWDDEQLQQEAQRMAEAEAHEHLDLVLAELEGLTQAQRSESILHAAIKSILLEAKVLSSPVFKDVEHRHMPDGDTRSAEVVLSLGDLALSQARAEASYEDVRPDVHCRATALRHAPFDLFIEVAVAHRVDPSKLQKIVALDVACMEIDVRDFRRRGRVTRDELRAEVLHNPGNKRWLHHPLIASRRAEALQALERKAFDIGLAQETRRRTRAWLEALPREGTLETYRQALNVYWRWGNWSGVTQVSGHSVDLPDLSNRLAETGLAGTDMAGMVGYYGVIRFLHLCRLYASISGSASVPKEESLSVILEELNQTREGRSLVTYCLMGLKVFRPRVPPQELQELTRIRDLVVESLQEGSDVYARSCQQDDLVRALYPELAESLRMEFGTHTHARALQQAAAQHAHAKWLEDMAAMARKREADVAVEKFRKAMLAQHDVIKAIENAGRRGWQQKLGLAGDVEQIMQHHDVKQLQKRLLPQGVDVLDVLTSAWKAREDGVALQDWLKSRSPASPEEVGVLANLLRTAWLV